MQQAEFLRLVRRETHEIVGDASFCRFHLHDGALIEGSAPVLPGRDSHIAARLDAMRKLDLKLNPPEAKSAPSGQ